VATAAVAGPALVALVVAITDAVPPHAASKALPATLVASNALRRSRTRRVNDCRMVTGPFLTLFAETGSYTGGGCGASPERYAVSGAVDVQFVPQRSSIGRW
jgi:hypothetical protein